MFTIDGLIWMLLAVVLVFAAIQQAGDGKRQMSDRTHRMVCCAALAVGVLVRLVKLSSLPAGISAEEALVGVQAKSLWQTGGFLFGQGMTTQLAQWQGETTGPLLAALTAPLVGLFGMNPRRFVCRWRCFPVRRCLRLTAWAKRFPADARRAGC